MHLCIIIVEQPGTTSTLPSCAGPEQGGSGPDLLMLHIDAQDFLDPPNQRQPSDDFPLQQQQQGQHASGSSDSKSGRGKNPLGWLDAVVQGLLSHKSVGHLSPPPCVLFFSPHLHVGLCGRAKYCGVVRANMCTSTNVLVHTCIYIKTDKHSFFHAHVTPWTAWRSVSERFSQRW